MTDNDDELDRLISAANPADEALLPGPADSPQAQLLYEQITGTPYGGRVVATKRRTPWRPFTAVIAAAALAGGGVAYAQLSPHQVTRAAQVACFSGPSLTAPQSAQIATSRGPVGTCAQAWTAGRVGKGPVPLLAACVGPTGIADVFPTEPGADVCAHLSLIPLAPVSAPITTAPSGPPTTDSRFFAARDAITGSLATGCITADQAKRIAEQILTKAAVRWTVAIATPFAADRPCASPSFDETTQQVFLVGLPRSDRPGG